MSRIDILVPDLPESVPDATVVIWHKKPGDTVDRDEILLEIETDKVILEVPASIDGILDSILEDVGRTVTSRQIVGRLRQRDRESKKLIRKPPNDKKAPGLIPHTQESLEKYSDFFLTPSIRRFLTKHRFDPESVKGISLSAHLSRVAVENYLLKSASSSFTRTREQIVSEQQEAQSSRPRARNEKRVPLSRLRKRIAERLLDVKNSTAMLTTFNEVNMKPIMDLRKQYGDLFERRHGIHLGFMSFSIKVVAKVLKRYPAINASIDGNDVVYRNYFDVNMAVSTPRGLVTPVLRDVDILSIVDIEKRIKELAIKGRAGKLTVNELTGGNFTVTNGGVFGSLLSTPIINPPQSAILGMHAIKDRPMAVNGTVQILPMMYLALSYDHRLIDGRESVGFLVAIKELLEDPRRLLLDV